MRRLSERAVFVSMVPLGLALAALGVRQSTREPYRAVPSHGVATEFVPPPLFLLAAATPGVDQTLRADVERSSARVVRVGPGATLEEQRLRATGTLRLLADGTLADFDLDCVPRGDALASGWPRDLELHLRGVSARSRATAVPGVRACSLRCSAVIGGKARDAILAVTWLRLPGGTVEVHAVATLDWAPFDLPEPWSRWMLPGDAQYLLGIDLVLRVDR